MSLRNPNEIIITNGSWNQGIKLKSLETVKLESLSSSSSG
jgi:hypothetical protein